jgi:formylglycine-generating enzyme
LPERARIEMTTFRRWLIGTITLTVLGSGVVDFGRQEIQSAQAEPRPTAGYCDAEKTAPSEAARAGHAMGTAATATQTNTPEGSEPGSCPADMVEVAGDYCQVVEQICEEFISEKRDRCAKYRNTVRCFGKSRKMHFCIDRYEYPNQAGVKPAVAVTWDEARETCATEGKRLCTADEWTEACEGPQHSPYPYGFARNSETCNHDRTYIIPDDNAYQNPQTRAQEVARLSQSEPSGSRPGCISAFGVFDMTGNVDEWVLNESGNENGPEYQSGLKGGYWGPVRNRCRPATTDHNRWHHGYQIGFRCCADPSHDGQSLGRPAAKTGAPADTTEQLSADNLVSRS